ncbi:MAG TPA: UvrD-helicase domain-containing protein [Acidobacteriaceae bacterium]|nr:UvrD-helicase domain-containing protein [Acidobacteriaceae bacterium]
MPDLLVPADAEARQAALDLRDSVIVQAPAGSGKTDLLTRRFLSLLAAVDEPEDILAITFTRAATAEMRARILSDLEAAAGRRAFRPEELPRIASAREALAHAERRGWRILEQPQRLSIETIDSLCLRIAHHRPLLAGLGGRLQPTEQADPLYALAARRTLEHLGGADAVLDNALAHFLDLRDNRLADCESLLAEMLRVRDQWQHAFPLSGAMSEDDWELARVQLQAPLLRETRRVLGDTWRLVEAEPNVRDEILKLAHYACSQGNDNVALLTGVQALSPNMPVDHWRCLCDLLLTEKDEWRKAVDRRNGFPVDRTRPETKERKDAMIFILGRLHQMPQLLEAFCAIRSLPPAAYSREQWTALRHFLTVLRQAIAELRVVFAEQGAVDFTEITLAAVDLLRRHPERGLDLAHGVRHLLVDEFQDTSRRQHELIQHLLAAWETGEHRTVFFVGDPMQSIYMFRQAEVELFTHVRDHGIGPEDNRIPCRPVQLSVNFRSHGGLTDPLNEFFAAIGAETPPPGSAAVSFSRATASSSAPTGKSLHVCPQIVGSAAQRPTLAEKREARQQEARQVLGILEKHLPVLSRARQAGSEYRVTVLVRARPHLAELLPLLRRAGIPFRAVEIELLTDRQELLDLRSLTRALLHPMDRIAWLAVLRAPWCGLTLADLHCLTGSDDPDCRRLSVLELIERNAKQLSSDGQRRLARTAEILQRALELRWRASESPSFASWIERTWRTLGGPACVDATGYENAQVFFSLLDAVAPDGLAALTPGFDAELNRLFAQPDPAVSERCGIQLMTIHKAKGLGFDVVIVPGLDRKPAGDAKPLVCSLERISPWDSDEIEFLVAPIGLQGEKPDPLYKWVRRQRRNRFDEERKRLFYVACTRARSELHLLGTAVASATGIKPEHAGSLLATAWPALRKEFEAALREPPAEPPASSRVLQFPEPAVIRELAAAGPWEEGVGSMPRRLPAGFEPVLAEDVLASDPAASGVSAGVEFRRPQGSRQARAVGSVVHEMLQRLGPELAHPGMPQIRGRALSLLRAYALDGKALRSATAAVSNLLLACATDPVCQWILAPHPGAQAEAAWTGSSGTRFRTLRADRVFQAGPVPLADGSECWWIIDYKTAPAPSENREAFLRAERSLYAPQLLAYAQALRALHGTAVPLRLGLYYPAIAALDYWDPGTD